MHKYDKLQVKWHSIIAKAKKYCDLAFIEIGEKASADEFMKIETELGVSLPPSFRAAVMDIGKSFELYYSLYDYILPDDLSSISSGRLSWNISSLSSMDDFSSSSGKLKNMYRFSESGNGDVYAFDMSGDGLEKPVYYWDHETDEFSYLANSFEEYLEKITELYCVGDEIWQFEEFLDDNGLNTALEKARNWKNWFDSFTTTDLADVTNDFDKLFQFAMSRKNLDGHIIVALRQYDYHKEALFEKLKEALIPSC